MKSKFLFIVAAFILSTTQLMSQGGNSRTFKSMGYDDASINGITGSLSYFIKVRPEDDINQSNVVINVRASQVLNPNNSFLVVYLKDEPVYTQRIVASAVDTLLSFSVRLSDRYLQPDGRFIRLKVAAKMSVSEEYCKDVDNPACWVVVKNTSYISGLAKVKFNYDKSIKEIIQEFSSVYTPASADENDLSAGGLVYAILRQGAASKEVYTGAYTQNDSVPAGVLVGLLDKLPYIVKQGLPVTPSSGQGLIANVKVGDGYVLVVTGADIKGYNNAIGALGSNRRLSSAFSGTLLVQAGENLVNSPETPSPLVTSLEDIGGDPGLMEGIGGLRKKYNFSLAEFNAIPNKLTFHIESYFSTLKPDDRGFLNVYLNQNLVYNASLLDKPNFIGDIDLKPYLLSKFNTLEVEFRFHPGSNVCKDGFSNFFAFVNTKTSTLTFAGERENRFYSFFNFPAEFRRNPTVIAVSPSLLKENIVASIGEIYYQLNTPLKSDFNKLIVPKIKTTSGMGEFSNYNVIALVQKGDPFVSKYNSVMPVNFDKDWQLYKDATGKLNYSVTDFSNSGLAQIFRDKSQTILMVTALGGDSTVKTAYFSVVKNFTSQLTEIESNVCIANSNGLSNYFFKAPEGNSVVSYKGDKSSLEKFWDSYKLYILGLILILILLAFFFVRNRVRKATDAVV